MSVDQTPDAYELRKSGQSPHAIRQLLEAGYPATALAYYRGGMHDWVSLAMSTEPRED